MEMICAVELKGNRPGMRIGFVKFYEMGYYAGTLDRQEWTKEQVKQAIAEYNLEHGIPADVAESAALASIFGWHTPAADRAIQFFRETSAQA
jgi:hypothetical protein